MRSKLARWSWILALPVSAVLAAPAEHAVEVPLNSIDRPVTKSITTTKRESKPTDTATTRTERSLSMRDVAPAGADKDGVYHSIRDWVPRTPTKAPQAQAQSEEANHAHRAHWWSRPQSVASTASTQKAEEVKP
jgi:hypothetical protein